MVIWTYKGGEFLSKTFNKFCEMHGIYWQLTTTNSSHQDDVKKKKREKSKHFG
jgi:hypothetical protein